MRLFGVLAAAGTFAVPVADLAAQTEIPDMPRQRWEYFYQQRAFPFEQVPPLAYQRAREAYAARWSGLFFVPPPIQGTQWQPIGPERIPFFGQSTGRLSAIAIHPTNSSIIYVGGAQGGVWRTDDGGTNWTALTDSECSLAMGSIAIDPDDPDIVYAGTGEQHFSGDSYYGCGVLRSTDGGTTWTQFGASVFQTAAGGARISRVVVDPATAGTANQTTVFAASDFGLFRSLNSGQTWTQLTPAQGFGQGYVTDLVLDPTNPDILYAGVWDRPGSTDGVYRSTNGGNNWTRLSAGFPTANVGRINIAIDPVNPATLYAAIHNSGTNRLLGVLRTQNSGASWSVVSGINGAECGFQCWYDMDIAVHPTNPDTLYFGGVFLYRSIDGGATFENITDDIHVDQHIIAFDPQNPDVVFVGNDGGIYRSNDAGDNWTTLNTTLALTQFYAGVSLHPTDPLVVLAGTQDNGTLQAAGTPDWLFVLGGDGGFTAIDQDNPDIRYAETQWSPGSGFSGPRRLVGGQYQLRVNGIVTSDRALFIPPLVMDPSNSSTLYFGTFRVYRTVDGANSWTVISPDLTSGSGAVSAVAPAPSDVDVVYAGTSDGLVQRTPDGGQSWTLANTGLPLRHVKDIAVDPNDPNIAYVAVSGFGSGHVFRTTNGGASWQDISGDLPDVPMNAILLDPGDPNRIFGGSDLGVFSTSNGGIAWVPFNAGLPNVAVFDLAYNPNTGVLLAATHGRGMFTVQMATPIALDVAPQVRADTVPEGTTAFSTDSAEVQLTGTGSTTAGWTATHLASASWVNLTNSTGIGSGMVRWQRNPTGRSAGIYVDTITVMSAGAIGSPVQVVDTLHVLADITLTVTPPARTDSAPVGQQDPMPDSAAVGFQGTGGASVAWTAAASASMWLTVTTGAGTGPGMVRWTRDPSTLAAGEYVDTITVTAPGVQGSPARLVDTLRILPELTVAVAPSSVRVSVVEGQLDSLAGSGTVNMSGFGAGAVDWTATHGAATWVSMREAQGTGSGTVRWMRDLQGLTPGLYVDTIMVAVDGAQGSPASIVDTTIVVTPIVMSVAPLVRQGTAVAGDTAAIMDSVEITLTGTNADLVSWQANVTAGTWITIPQPSGQGSGQVRWIRTPSGLAVGEHGAMITIAVGGAEGSPVDVSDRLVILEPPITIAQAIDALLNETSLSNDQITYLDERGNADGTFNLGDVMAYFERSQQSAAEARERAAAINDSAGTSR